MESSDTKMVLVRWVDSIRLTSSAWHERTEVEDLEAAEVLTCGFLVRETDQSLVVVQSLGPQDSSEFGAPIAIPRVAVVERKELS